jgi:uncharacterized protein (DUF2062 family)
MLSSAKRALLRVGQDPRGDKNKYNTKNASQNPHSSLPHWSPQMYARYTEPVTLLVGRENEQRQGWYEHILANIIGARTLCVEMDGGRKEGFFRQRITRPVAELLRRGVTPEKMALSLALGVALGVFPILGTTTALCALAGLILRLNLPAIQIVNYFVYPLQIVLLIPFFRLGESLFGAPHLPLSIKLILTMVHASFWGATQFLWTTIWHAAVAWCLLAPLFVGLMYASLVPLLRHMVRRPLKERTTD